MFGRNGMSRLSVGTTAVVLAVALCHEVRAAETNASARAEGTVKSGLATENDFLREENRKLREELVQGAAAEQNKAKVTAADAASSTSTNGAVLYWITSGSKKRHNPSCRYYKKSKGYLTTEKEGTPCKICGG